MYVQNAIFGKIRLAGIDEQKEVQKIIKENPLDVFQALNVHLNSLGYMLSISTKRS